jgi:hypothetical protein
VGATLERVAESGHPQGEAMLVMTPIK